PPRSRGPGRTPVHLPRPLHDGGRRLEPVRPDAGGGTGTLWRLLPRPGGRQPDGGGDPYRGHHGADPRTVTAPFRHRFGAGGTVRRFDLPGGGGGGSGRFGTDGAPNRVPGRAGNAPGRGGDRRPGGSARSRGLRDSRAAALDTGDAAPAHPSGWDPGAGGTVIDNAGVVEVNRRDGR